MNLMMLLEMARSAMGERVAVHCGREVWSQAELFAGAGRVASLLRGAGAIENVAYLDVLNPALPLALFGAAWAGRPFAPLNYRLAPAELDALLERLHPLLLITDAAHAAQIEKRAGLEVLTCDALLEHARSTAVEPAPGDWPMDKDAVAVLLFTSGTTGAPKAAVLGHQHLLSYILGSVEFMSAAEDSATLVSLPPYHVAGMAAILSSVYAGRRIVQLPAFSPEAWLESARSEGITHAFVVPTMLARIVSALAEPGARAPERLEALAYGGGRMPLPVIEQAMKLFPPSVAFTNAYGLTETSSTIALLAPEEHRLAAESNDAAVRGRLASVGRPLPGVEVEIRDADGKAVPAGEPGEIWVRGEQVSGAYRDTGSQLTPGGWFPTNDSGAFDEAGYLFVSGRMDDVIVRGGENLSPGEIEAVLYQHEAVADCAVVGVPDEQWGEDVGAAVVLKAEVTVAELQAWVRGRLRSSRVPRWIEFWEQLPYNETGKLLRRKVREALTRHR